MRISGLTFVELQSVFAIKARSGFITQAEAFQQRARLAADVAGGEIEVYGVTPVDFAEAGRLIGKHGFTTRLRTLDAIQLAVALDLSHRHLVDQFPVSDKVLAEVATREGLSVLDPGLS